VTESTTQNGQRMNIIQFLEDNDISVTKFLDYMEDELTEPQQNILITEFLETDYEVALHDSIHDSHPESPYDHYDHGYDHSYD